MANENVRSVAEVTAEGDVRIIAEKKAGEKMRCSIEAPTAAEALAGITCLIQDFSGLTGIPVTGVLGRLAVVLLGKDEPETEE